MKRARHVPAPNTLQPGHYIFWQQRTYQVIAHDPDNALLLHVQPLPEGPGTLTGIGFLESRRMNAKKVLKCIF